MKEPADTLREDRQESDLPDPAAHLVAMTGIVKRFGTVVANDGVDLGIRAGEIHALLGENGAGKTTLMNILYGLIRRDEGQIFVRGAEADIRSPQDAIELRIGMVHQHYMLVPTLTVAEHMVLGERQGPHRKPKLEEAEARLLELQERYGLQVSPREHVWRLSVGEQQRVEILRALYRNADVLILDEPTAALAPSEIEQFLERLRELRDHGNSVVLITHHLDEVMVCADSISVMRAGRRMATLTPAETTTRELARLMVGESVKLRRVIADPEATIAKGTEHEGHEHEGQGPSGPARRQDAVLRVRDLRARNDRGQPALEGISFDVCRGEILAVAGVEGNGQAELEAVLLGLRPAAGGKVHLGSEELTGLPPKEIITRGVGSIPSDRYRRGLVRELPIAENLVLDRVGHAPFSGGLGLRLKEILAHAQELIRRFSIRVDSPWRAAGALSGGNAQRVVLARALSNELRVLVAAQPTRGLDVGAIEFVWDQIAWQRDRGLAVLLISTDLDEVLALADRCLVIYKGELVREFAGEGLEREAVGLAMGGSRSHAGDD